MTKPDLKQLKRIPGVGENIAQDLWNIGIRSRNDLKGRSADRLYRKLCDFKAAPVDRCVLYVLRCAIYYASNAEHDPELLKWWSWKDGT
ncbi:MAG TPA: helix-hairpin-helix domain-containing protein [Sedimentisphaerales bacterium]|nr:helix-hairpin-helix domain-containing protein [Sedimentisphaerales bacterium]